MAGREAAVRILAAEIVATAAGPEGWPREGLPEVAVLGRSNVGKSSLLNRLAGRRKLARTSGTPGKTRLLHFFRLVRPEGELLLVDLPGYGYAKVSRREREGWRRMIEGYLEGREALRAALLLHDARREPGEDETLLLAWLAEREIRTLVVLTKIDKLRPRERAARLRALSEALPVEAENLVATSAKTGAGIAALWRALDTHLGRPRPTRRRPAAGPIPPPAKPSS
jgi:GTP-binding protein